MTILDFNECSICFHPIKKSSNTYSPNFTIGLVCEKCNQVFYPEQMDIITHAFNAVRGIFEDTENLNVIVKDVLYDIQSELKLHNKETFSVQFLFQKILLRSQVYCLKLNTLFLTNYHHSKEISKIANCEICHKPTTRYVNNANPKLNNENICKSCKLKFSKGEILTMSSLFERYGGFFNKLGSQKPPLEQILENFLNNIKKEKSFSRMIEFNEVALHCALLFGYRPKKFTEELKKF